MAEDRLRGAFRGVQEDYDAAFAEIYCVGMEVLDVAWLDMRASYMDFPAVMKCARPPTRSVTAASKLRRDPN